MKKKILLLLFTLNFFIVLPNTIKGKITDITNEQIVGSKIELVTKDTTIITYTNLDGEYKFNNIKSGKYIISIYNISYKNIKSLISINKNKNIDFKIERTN